MSSSKCDNSKCSSESTTEIMTKCEERFKNFRGCKRVKEIEAYSIDTCIIKYKPRLLVVPSPDFCTLDDAICALRPQEGGYVIKLSPGVHELKRSLCRCVDDLTFLGDCNPFAGIPFIQRCRTRVIEEGGITVPPPPFRIPLCRNFFSDVTGIGPYDLVVSGKTVRVIGNGQNPCFDGLCQGTKVGFFDRRGNVVVAEIQSVSNNLITLNIALPITTNPNDPDGFVFGGEGFFVIPNTMITTAEQFLSIETSNSLQFIGVNLVFPPATFVHSPLTELSHCVVEGNITVRGSFYFPDPNVYTGTIFLWPSSDGEAIGQAVVGAAGHLELDTADAAWLYSNFASNVHGAELKNSGRASFFGTEFSNCCLGLSVIAGSNGSIGSTRFCHNTYALLVTYQSNVNSIPVALPFTNVTAVAEGPWFVRNLIAIMASYHGFVIVPNVQGYRNLIPFVIDAKLFTTIESNPIGTIYHWGSMVLFLPNPFAPEPSDLGCVESSSIPGNNFNEAIDLTTADIFAVTSPSFIESVVGPNGQSVNANETILKLIRDTQNVDTIRRNRLRFFTEASRLL